MDIVSENPEKNVAYIAVIMSWMRSLIGHISGSTKAQGILRWLALLVWNSDGDASLKDAPSSLAAVRYAPQRWLSQVGPLKAIVGRFNDIWMYLVMKAGETQEKDFAENLLKPMEDIRFFLILAGFLDILLVLDTFNKTTQPRGTSAEKVDSEIYLVCVTLEDMAMRQDSDGQGKEPCTFVKAGLLWWAGKHPASVPAKATHFEKMLARFSEVLKVTRKVHNPEGTSMIEVTDRRVEYTGRYKVKSGGPTKTTVRKIVIDESALKEVLIVLRAAGGSILRDLQRRFVKTGVVTDLLHVYCPAYDMSRQGVPESALGRIGEHYKKDADGTAGLTAAWKALQLRKEVVISTILKEAEVRAEGPQERTAVPFQECWRRVLQSVDLSPVAQEAVEAARDSVELPLLLECTNSGVERTAGLKRLLDEVMNGQGKASTIDARLRVGEEGPAWSKVTIEHEFILESCKHFKTRVERREEEQKKRQAHQKRTPEAKANASLGAKRPKVCLNTDHPDEALLERVDAAIPDDIMELEEEVLRVCEDVLDPKALLGDMDELFKHDPTGRSSGFAAVAKPVPKKDRSKKKGDAFSAMPKADDPAGAEAVAAASLEGVAEDVTDDHAVAELAGGSEASSDDDSESSEN